MNDPLSTALRCSYDKRAVSSNTRHMPKQLRGKAHRFEIPHPTAGYRFHQVPMHYGIILSHLHVGIEIPSSVQPLLATSPDYMSGVVGFAMQRLSDLRTGAANSNFERIFQRPRNSQPMPKVDRCSIRPLDFHHVHRPTVGCFRHADLCKETVLMNEKDFGMIGLDMRHGFRPFDLGRAYHCGDRTNG